MSLCKQKTRLLSQASGFSLKKRYMSKYLSRKKSLGNNYRTAIIVAKVNIAFGYTRRKLNIFLYVHKKPPIFTDKRCHN